eukprot:m.105082 g.105082  ORF g.105082 m.105082 type:complete len:627 (-) comp9130_c0_seq2:2306-4186(-)
MGCASSHAAEVPSEQHLVRPTAEIGLAEALPKNFAWQHKEENANLNRQRTPRELGALKLRLIYERGQIILRIKQGRNLVSSDWNGAADPHVIIEFSGPLDGTDAKKLRRKTRVKPKTLNPIWDEQFHWDCQEQTDLTGLSLRLVVWDKDTITANDFMGSMSIPLALLFDEAAEFDGWFQLFEEDVGAETFAPLGLNWQPSIQSVLDCEGDIPVDQDAEDDSTASLSEAVYFDREESTSSSVPANLAAPSRSERAASPSVGKKGVFTRIESHQRKLILQEARELGAEHIAAGTKRHLTVIYNPVSGNGTAKKIVDHMVTPVFRLAHVEYDVVPTQYAGYAVEYMRELDISTTDGVIIAGGDGLVHEVVTGYCLRPDGGGGIPVGIVPSGTANAMAHDLHPDDSHTTVNVVGRAALAAARGSTRAVDVLKIENEVQDIYALSMFGWGLAGAVALQAAKMRWIPGQKRVRYDMAGFVTLIGHWPVVNEAKMSFLIEDKDPETGAITERWLHKDVQLVNMLITNLSRLGMDHAIYGGVEADDGHFAVVMLDGSLSRKAVINVAIAMKKGKYMGDQKECSSFFVKECKIVPKEGTRTPYVVDGDPHDPLPCHIKNLHKHIQVFALPKSSSK